MKPSGCKLALDDITNDSTVQTRAATSQAVIDEYADALRAEPGLEMPPIVVFKAPDGVRRLADGFHRLPAYRLAGRSHIPAKVIEGDRAAALIHSAASNRTHGHRRTPEDKRSAVKRILELDQCRGWTDNRIATHCGVAWDLVVAVRKELYPPRTSGAGSARDRPTYKTASGTETTMNVGAIGDKAEAEKLRRRIAVQVRLQVRGDSNRKIAQRLDCSDHTVASVRKSIAECPELYRPTFPCPKPACEHGWEDGPRWHCDGCDSHWAMADAVCPDCGEPQSAAVDLRPPARQLAEPEPEPTAFPGYYLPLPTKRDDAADDYGESSDYSEATADEKPAIDPQKACQRRLREMPGNVGKVVRWVNDMEGHRGRSKESAAIHAACELLLQSLGAYEKALA